MESCPSPYKLPKKTQLNKHKKYIYVSDPITENTTWSSKYNYILMSEIHVKSGATLTICPGTIIYANTVECSNPASIPALVVESDSKLIANGTRECPIIFTTVACLNRVFAVDPTTGKYTYQSGLGPFAEFWNGIAISGTGLTNTADAADRVALGGFPIPYGGTNPNSYNFELQHVYIYFAGIARLGTVALTIGAPSFYDKFRGCEILFGQQASLAVYGGALLALECRMGMTYANSGIRLYDGAQVYVTKSILIQGLSNINPDYQDDETESSFARVSTLQPGEVAADITRYSILFMNNCDLLSLTFTANFVAVVDEGRAQIVNNLFVGNCYQVLNFTETTNDGGPLPIYNVPAGGSALVENYIYLGANTYEHINGVYYSGPSTGITYPGESTTTVKEIRFLFYGADTDELVCGGRFLNLVPITNSDLFHNDPANDEENHVTPILGPSYWALLQAASTISTEFAALVTTLQKPSYAGGVIQSTRDMEREWRKGLFGFWLDLVGAYKVCPYWESILDSCEDSDSSSCSSSSSSSSSCSSSSSSSSESECYNKKYKKQEKKKERYYCKKCDKYWNHNYCMKCATKKREEKKVSKPSEGFKMDTKTLLLSNLLMLGTLALGSVLDEDKE